MNKAETWRILYAWENYVVAHLRYGSLIFTNDPGSNCIPSYVRKHRKLYNETVKKVLWLDRTTPDIVIRNFLGTWDHSVITNQGFIGAANTWIRTCG